LPGFSARLSSRGPMLTMRSPASVRPKTRTAPIMSASRSSTQLVARPWPASRWASSDGDSVRLAPPTVTDGEHQQQPHDAVSGLAQCAAAGRCDRLRLVVPAGRTGWLGRGAVPALTGGHGLAGVQGGGMAQLGIVADSGVNVEDGLLTDEDVRAESDGTDLDDTGPGAVAIRVHSPQIAGPVDPARRNFPGYPGSPTRTRARSARGG
jgi:hypothetical protein